jgi:hypothetical protein
MALQPDERRDRDKVNAAVPSRREWQSVTADL